MKVFLLISILSSLVLALSPYFYGINYWYFEKLSKEEFDLVKEALEDIPVDVIRIGGMWYDAKGIKTWVLRDFFDLCETLNATPIVQIPLNGFSVKDSLDFVKKIRSIYDGRIIWSIGNEMDIYEDVNFDWIEKMGMKESFEKYGKILDGLERIEKDPIVWGPDLSWKWRPWMVGDWTTPFLKRFEDRIDAFSIHRYPFRYVLRYSDVVRDVRAFYQEMKRLSRIGKPIALTETNLSWDWKFCGKMSSEGDIAGLWLSSIILRSIVLDLYNVSVWSAVNDSCLSILVVKDGKLKERGTYRALKIFKNVRGDVKDHMLSEYLDYAEVGRRIVAVNRSEKRLNFKLKGKIYSIDPMSACTYYKGKIEMCFKVKDF